jgi:hypothetical protein
MAKQTIEERLAAIEDQLQKKYVQMLFEHDRVIRSHAIYEATAIESLIENIVAWHFCSEAEKHLLFTGLMFVTAEVAFSKKIQILMKILQDSYADILNDIPGLENDLDSLRRFRNKFAHNELILDDEKLKAMKDGIWLRSINRDGKLVEEFISREDTDKRIRAAQRLRWYVFYIWLEVEHRVKGEQPNQLQGFLKAIKSGALDNIGEPERGQKAKEASVAAQPQPAEPQT